LHDLKHFDERGIPGVTVVTTEFADAMDVQSNAIGFEPAVIYTPHPIQNRTADELKKIADDVIEPALRLLQSG
jgi:hypothetical protein